MSRQIDVEAGPLSAEDRLYLEQRGNYAAIRKNEELFGAGEQDQESEASLDGKIEKLEEELQGLRDRKAALVLAREQEQAGVVDRTSVNGQGGEESDEDDYDDMTVDQLKAEITSRNADRDPEDRISLQGNKAALIERLRADDEEEDEDEDTE